MSKQHDISSVLDDKLGRLPSAPGCYLFKGAEGEVLYVGKAKNLRSRVRSYFQAGGSDDRAFLPLLRRRVLDVETLVTATEKEAAILENSLIKQNKPRFNVKLRDDKEYLNLRLDMQHEWPRLDLVRRPESDGGRYFGPYHSATAARRTLHLVEKHFQLRTCTDRELASRTRPCLQYQIKRCPAPCVYEVDREHYVQQVNDVALFLGGRHDELSRELGQRMQDASECQDYELAALYRDQLFAVRSVQERQRVVSVTDLDQDVLGLYREGDLVELSVLYLRRGRLVEAGSVSHSRTELPDDEVVANFLREHYGGDGGLGAPIPDEILLPILPEGALGVQDWLSERRAALAEREEAPRRGAAAKPSAQRKTRLLCPVRGPRRQLCDLALENAKHAFDEKRRSSEDVDQRLEKLQGRLRLPTLPRRIECCDISHLGGQDTYGSVVALSDGTPDNKRYKHYRVTRAEPGDDYAAMYEVLFRRFRRGKEAEAGDTWELPDLFVVDGGRGQLSVAVAAAHDLGLHDLQLAGLAKEKENVRGEKLVDRVYLPGQKNPIALKPNSPELFFLARARDEAHRFANRARRRAGKKRRLSSELTEVPGIGPKLAKALLTSLGSVARVRQASEQDLLQVPGVGRSHVAALRQHFGEPGETD